MGARVLGGTGEPGPKMAISAQFQNCSYYAAQHNGIQATTRQNTRMMRFKATLDIWNKALTEV
jgi:hypothetical protein